MRRYILLLFSLLLFFKVYGLDYTVSYGYNLPQFSVPLEILAKNYYNAGEYLNVTIKVYYGYEYYFPDAKLVVQLIRVYDNNSIYPSELADHNIILERVYNLSLEPGKTYDVNFEYRIPENIEGGRYAIAVYLYTPLSYLSGLPFIFLPGNFKYIYINGNGDYPEIKINRKLTQINEGPATVGINATDKISVRLVIDSKKDTNVRIVIKYAEWDDITRENSVLYDGYVNLSRGTNYIYIERDIGKLESSVYSARIEVYEGNTLQSLYRLRFIKIGPTAKLRGILLNKDGNVTVIVGPSPDHYTYPVTKDVWLELQSNGLNYYKKIYLGNIGYYSTGFVYVKLNLNLTKENFDLCANLYSGDKITDKYCINYYIPKRFLDVYQDGNKLVVKSSEDVTVIIEDLKNNKSTVYRLSKGENVFYLGEGEYRIGVLNSIYLEKEVKVTLPIGEKISSTLGNVLSNPQNFSRLLIVILIIALIVILYMIVRLFRRGAKGVMYLFILLIALSLLSGSVYSYINISDANVCSIGGNIKLITNFSSNYTVEAKLYDKNQSLIYSKKYNCSGYCERILSLPNLTAGFNYTLQVITNLENKTFNITALYPYKISLLSNQIYVGSYTAVKIEPVEECSNISGYNNTLFIITYDSTVLRRDCPYSGDPEWGSNICGIDTTSLAEGSYNIYAKYYLPNTYSPDLPYIYFNQFVGTLTILPAPSGNFTSTPCSHGWSQGNSGLQYNISIVGNYTVDEGMFVLAPGSTLRIYNIGSINYLCSNAHYSTMPGRIAVFVYKSLINKPINNYTYGVFVGGKDNMGNIYPSSLGNIMKEIYEDKSSYGFIVNISSPNQSFDAYTFSNPGYYLIYINRINAYCDSPAIYVCPSTNSSNNLCNIGVWKDKPPYYVGWYILGQQSVLVPNPDIKGTYFDRLTIYPYYSYSDNRWYAYIVDYSTKDYNGHLDVSLVRNQPLNYIKVGKFTNIGLGKVKVEGRGDYIYNYVNISEGVDGLLLLDIEKAVSNLCKNVNCVIKYNLSYRDAYDFYEPKIISNPIIEVKWAEINISVEPGYFDGIVLLIRLNITNENSYVEAQNIGLKEAIYDNNCIKVLPTGTISLSPKESGILQIPIVFLRTNCPQSSYNATFVISGINTEQESIQINVLDYYKKSLEIYLTKGRIIVEEKIILILPILLIIALLLLL